VKALQSKSVLPKALLPSLVGFFWASGLYAQDASQLMEASIAELLSVEVSIATRSKQPLTRAPASVTVYTRTEIRRMGITSLGQLLNYVPGVQTARSQQDGLYDTSTFRGRGDLHGSAPPVLVMIDGRRLNSPVSGGAFDAPLNNLDWVKQVEIIRGPGSTLYGANAFNGVINLVTEILPRDVTVRLGENGLREASLQVRGEQGEFGAGLYLHTYRYDGENYAPFFNFVGELDATQDPFERDTLGLDFEYRDWYLKGYYTEGQVSDFVQGSTQGNGVVSETSTHENIRIGYRGWWGDDWSLDIYADYMNVVSDFFLRVMPAGLAQTIWWTDGSFVEPIGGNHLQWGYDQLALDGRFRASARHQISYGLEYRNEWADLNPFHGNWNAELMEASLGTVIEPCDCISKGFWFNMQRADFLPASERNVRNLWIQDQWQINRHFDVTLGLRHDEYDDVGGNTSLRSALVYHMSQTTQFKLLYGEAFRAPTLSETRTPISSSFVGNPDLQPETIQTLDLVWQQQWTSSNLVLTWSHSTIKNEVRLALQDEEYQPGIIPFQPVNAGELDLEDIELELNTNLGDGLLLRFGLTHHLEYTQLGTAENLAFISINRSLRDWNINLNGYYHDRVLSRKTDGVSYTQDIHLKAFWNFNLNTSYQVNQGLSVFLRAENLLNEDYRTYTTADNLLEFGIPGQGRRLSAGLRWSL